MEWQSWPSMCTYTASISGISTSKEGRDSPEGENQGTIFQMLALVLSAVRLIVELAR